MFLGLQQTLRYCSLNDHITSPDAELVVFQVYVGNLCPLILLILTICATRALGYLHKKSSIAFIRLKMSINSFAMWYINFDFVTFPVKSIEEWNRAVRFNMPLNNIQKMIPFHV